MPCTWGEMRVAYPYNKAARYYAEKVVTSHLSQVMGHVAHCITARVDQEL